MLSDVIEALAIQNHNIAIMTKFQTKDFGTKKTKNRKQMQILAVNILQKIKQGASIQVIFNDIRNKYRLLLVIKFLNRLNDLPHSMNILVIV